MTSLSRAEAGIQKLIHQQRQAIGHGLAGDAAAKPIPGPAAAAAFANPAACVGAKESRGKKYRASEGDRTGKEIRAIGTRRGVSRAKKFWKDGSVIVGEGVF